MKSRGAGFTTLTMSLLLLAILSTWSLFLGKTMVAEQRLALNEIEYRLTQAIAEQGAAEAMAMFNVDPAINGLAGSVSHDLAEISYQVMLAPHGSLKGIYHLQSTASLASGARSRVRLALAERSILSPLHTGPHYPLLLAGTSTAIHGQLQIISNQNVANQAAAHTYSAWSAGNISVSGALHSCDESDYDVVTNSCTVSLSNIDAFEQRLGPDLKLQDPAFPADMLQYVFGYDTSQGRHIEAMATAIVSDCSQIKSAGFYIVNGGASCQLERVVSSANAPLILLVKNMEVVAHIPVQFYGLLILHSTDSNPRSLSLASGSELNGGLMMDVGYNEINGDFLLRYDADVLCILSACQPTAGASPFRLLSVLPGSWYDD